MLLPLVVAALLMTIQTPAPPFPQVTIAGPHIEMTVWVPDAKHGYYRGTRFDWSGAIASLRWNGHEYFGPWFERHDPLAHDGITGPVEEFVSDASSVGYDEAPTGGTFVRIGVGHVRKPDEPAYRRFATYEIVDPGAWSIDRRDDAITFTHRLPDASGYAYSYRKTLRIDGDTLVIDHALRNTGRKPIATSVYNHNFFTIDGRPTGSPVVVRFPFDPQLLRPVEPLGEIADRALRFRRELGPGEHVFTELTGYGTTASDYDLRVEQRDTGAAVRIRGDRPLTKLIVWSADRTVCPEPYIDVSVGPGEETTWRLTYQFHEVR